MQHVDVCHKSNARAKGLRLVMFLCRDHNSPPQMPKKRLVLEDLYDVEKILARRVKRGGIEYLVAWEGYGTEADTWEPPEHLPKRFINRYMRFRAELPASFEVCLTDLRDKIARRLLESKGPTFGCEAQCEKAALPEYAEALLRYLGSPRGGEKVKLKLFYKDGYKVQQLVVTDLEHGAWIVGLHHARPDHGVGALRIRTGKTRACNLLLVAVSEVTPIILTYRAPTGVVAGINPEGIYSFKVEFSTVGINGASGDIMPYMAPPPNPADPDQVDLRLDPLQAEALMAYSKRTLKQEHALKPLQHFLRAQWMYLPAGQWLLPGY